MKEIEPGSNRWRCERIKEQARNARDNDERRNLIDAWMREVRVIEKIQKLWEPWMGTPPHWLINRNRRNAR